MNFLSDSFQQIAILDYIQWILIVGGILLMLIAFALVMSQERLLCFRRTGKITFESQPGVYTSRGSSFLFPTTVVHPKSVSLDQLDSNANVRRQNNNFNRN